MSADQMSDASHDQEHDGVEGDEKYLMRNKRQIRGLLRSLIEKRALVTAHLGGRDQSIPTAVLEVDEDDDWLLLDGSPNDAANRAAQDASHLLCFAQLDRVRVRFRIEQHERVEQDGHVGFRAPLPETLYYLQRREFYRLETPVTDSPTCLLRLENSEGEQVELDLRVIDISGGGLAVSLAPGMPLPETNRTYWDCVLAIPEHPPITVPLTICSRMAHALPNGLENIRIGMQFADLPRGADEVIQRYIFRIDRLRNARKSGVF